MKDRLQKKTSKQFRRSRRQKHRLFFKRESQTLPAIWQAKEKFDGQYEGRTRDLGVISTTL
jgi:hypothetical protein